MLESSAKCVVAVAELGTHYEILRNGWGKTEIVALHHLQCLPHVAQERCAGVSGENRIFIFSQGSQLHSAE